jgi:hypothetical protein
VEFDRTGRSLPIDDWYDVDVQAYEVCVPEGTVYRVVTLKDAKAFIAYSRALRDGKVGTTVPAPPSYRCVRRASSEGPRHG